MKTKVSPAIVGAFVLGAFTLGILALLFFGGVSFFHKQQRFLVNVDEPAQGLTDGSSVKLRGVTIGRVVDVYIRYDAAKNHSVVTVVGEFDRNKVTDSNGKMIDVSNRDELAALINHGLRAQLGMTGLAAGTLYVELDFLDPKAYPAGVPLVDANHPDYPVVPWVLSTISEFQESAMEILTRIKRIDFEGLTNDLKSLLVDAKVQIDALDTKDLTVQWQKTGASMDALANSPEIKQAFVNLNLALTELRSRLGDVHETLAHVDTQVDSNGKSLQASLEKVQATLEQFNAAALTIRRFVESQQNLGDDAHKALIQLAGAAESVQRLADFIERNPNALVSGRKQP